MTYDYDASRRTRTSILMGDLTDHYSTNIEANHLLIALDACSAGLALKVPGERNTRAIPIEESPNIKHYQE